MNLINRIRGMFLNNKSVNRQRSFKAAMTDRTTDGWQTASSSIDKDIKDGSSALRARARDAVLNNEYGAAYRRMLVRNVIGSHPEGIKYQNLTRLDNSPKPDKLAQAQIERSWQKFISPEYLTKNERYGLRDVLIILLLHLKVDGEFFVRILKDTESPFGIRIDIIEPDYIDLKKNEYLENGNQVRMGVEVDKWGKPIAYHVRERKINDLYSSLDYISGELKRIPADEIIHVFKPIRAYQTRGFSDLAPILHKLHQLKGWEDASVVNARASASKMGFYTKSEKKIGDATYTDGGSVQTNGDVFHDFAPGQIGELPDGWGFQGFDPKYPHEQHTPFLKSNLRGFAAGLGVGYNNVANDAENVNFSSIRAFTLQEQDEWKEIQSTLIERFLDPLHKIWLKNTLAFGTLTGELMLPFAKLDKFMQHKFQGRRWNWVDPVKEVSAKVNAINNNLTTLSRELADQGLDFDEVIEQRAYELARLKEAGIVIEQMVWPSAPAQNIEV